MSKVIKLIIPESFSGTRLDKALTQLLPEYSRAYLQSLIAQGGVLLSGAPVKSNSKVKGEMKVEITFPDPKKLDLIPVKMDLNILYEDEELLVLNKSPGVVVHPAAGNRENTLVHGLLNYCKDLSSINGVLRPGIVHRLDKDTSGCLVVAKNDEAHQALAAQFANREIKKIYQCFVLGQWKKGNQQLTGAIGRHPVDRKRMTVKKTGGRNALSIVTPLEIFKEVSFLEVELKTGRTHQIRVHLSHEGHPIVGDQLYGRNRVEKKMDYSVTRQFLHASTLEFTHPKSKKRVNIKAELPEDMAGFLKYLKR